MTSPLLFFFNDTATTEIYTLSLHDALPIFPDASVAKESAFARARSGKYGAPLDSRRAIADRKSTRLNSSHLVISYAVFCLKKKKKTRATVLNSKLIVHAIPRRRRTPPYA